MQATSELEGLPAPTGRHGVGRVSFDWVDQGRAEVYSSNPQDRRALVVWIWYPATPDPDAERAAYLPEPWAPSGQFLGLDAAGLLSHAVAGAPVAGEQPRYPVLVLSPSGFPPLLLAAIAEELASHGYVVVGVNHTYETPVTVFADGRSVAVNPDAQAGVLGPQTGPYQERFRERGAVCDYKAADLASVADRLQLLAGDATGLLAGRLDLDRLGGFGHSFGGNAALQCAATTGAAGPRPTWTGPCGPRWDGSGWTGRHCSCWPSTPNSPAPAPMRSRRGRPPTLPRTTPRRRSPSAAGAPSTAAPVPATPCRSRGRPM
jgi:predicted dienelactone hydrolase